jgi:hypothetical protein
MLASPMNAVDQILTVWMDGQDCTHSREMSASGT